MTQAVKKLLEQFEALPKSERDEVLAELARRVAHALHDLPSDDDRALVTLVPHTTSVRQSQFEAVVAVPFLRPGAFDAQSLVTIPHAKLLRQLGKLSEPQLAVVETAVRSWLG